MEQDRTELHDLAEAQPERTRRWRGVERMGQADARPALALEASIWRVGSRRCSKTIFSSAGRNAARPERAADRSREIAIEATLDGDGEGVIVAQGGLTLGYALYIKNGRPGFAIRQEGRLYLVTAAEPLPKGAATLTATLTKDGKIKLTVNGKEAATGKAQGLFASQPGDALCAGFDDHDPVGPYTLRSDTPVKSKADGSAPIGGLSPASASFGAFTAQRTVRKVSE